MVASSIMNEAMWYLKKPDNSVYGPVTLSNLGLWAMDGRVAPEDQVSTDQQQWGPAYELSELEMDYTIRLSDGTEYGPIHRIALCDMVGDGSISPTAIVIHGSSGEQFRAYEIVLPALSAERASLMARIDAMSGVAARDEVSDRESEHGLRAELNVVTEKNAELMEEVEELTEEKSRLEEELDNAESDLSALRLKGAESSGGKEDRSGERESPGLQDHAEQAVSDPAIEELRRELDEERGKARQTDETLQAREERILALEKELEEARAAVENDRSVRAVEDELHKRVREVERVRDQQADRLKELEKDRTALEDKLRDQSERLERAMLENDSLKERIKAMESGGVKGADHSEGDRGMAPEREKQLQHRLDMLQAENKRMKAEMACLPKSETQAVPESTAGEHADMEKAVNPVVQAALSRMKSQMLSRRSGMPALRPAKQSYSAGSKPRRTSLLKKAGSRHSRRRRVGRR